MYKKIYRPQNEDLMRKKIPDKTKTLNKMSDMTIVSTLSPISSMQKIQFDYNEHQR